MNLVISHPLSSSRKQRLFYPLYRKYDSPRSKTQLYILHINTVICGGSVATFIHSFWLCINWNRLISESPRQGFCLAFILQNLCLSMQSFLAPYYPCVCGTVLPLTRLPEYYFNHFCSLRSLWPAFAFYLPSHNSQGHFPAFFLLTSLSRALCTSQDTLGCVFRLATLLS